MSILAQHGLLMTSGSIGPSYADVVAVDAPVAWWRLNTTVTNGGNAPDASGNSRAAVFAVGSADAAAQPGAPLVYGSPSSYAKTGANPGGALATGMPTFAGSYSVEAWIRTSDNGAARAIVAIDNESTQRLFQLRLNSGVPTIINIRGAIVVAAATAAVTDNAPHHLVATVDVTSTTNNVKIYVDGTLAATGSGDVTGSVGGDASIGSYNGTSLHPEYQFSGSIADAALYDKVLSPARVAAHWNAGVGRPAPTPYETAVMGMSPLVFIPFNDASGTQAGDISGNGRHGIYPAGASLSGSPMFVGGSRSARLPFAAVRVPYGAWQDLTGDFTVILAASAAAPAGSTGNFPKLFTKFVDSFSGYATYMLQGTKSDGHFLGRTTTTDNNYNDASSTDNIMDGQPRLVFLRRIGAELSLWYNASKVATAAVSGTNRVANNDILIGGAGTTDGIDASVMWFSLHDRGLSDAEIANLYTLATTPI